MRANISGRGVKALASRWADNSGADVTLRAVPTGYTEGVIATFLVTHNGTEAVSIPCTYTAPPEGSRSRLLDL